jgi:hypothetical protein
MRTSALTSPVRFAITERVARGDTNPGLWVANAFNISRRTASLWLAKLCVEGQLSASGSTRKSYVLGATFSIDFFVPILNLDEHQLWVEKIEPFVGNLPPNVRGICHHGFTEMVNNAHDHSGGQDLWVKLDLNERRVRLVIDDDGVGIFKKIQGALNLPDPRLSLLELAKGKFTTDPKNHSGEGIFFTSRMFDDFAIFEDGLIFSHQDGTKFDYLFESELARKGTMVAMEIDRQSGRKTNDVFYQFAPPDELSFDRTIVPMRMARIGDENLVSRSQAKRVILRFDRFKYVELDFTGVESIGQAFADEIFRVYARAHPQITISCSHATPEIQQMVVRARTTDVV